MNKPELDEAIKLFKEFHTKQVDSVPSIKEDWEINGEINIPSEPNKLQKKSMNSEPEETVELNTLSPQSQPNGTTKKVIHIQNDSKSHEKKNKIGKKKKILNFLKFVQNIIPLPFLRIGN